MKILLFALCFITLSGACVAEEVDQDLELLLKEAREAELGLKAPDTEVPLHTALSSGKIIMEHEEVEDLLKVHQE